MPSFSIEVPGETNPLTEQTLVHTLAAASSSKYNQIQTGTAQLQQWEHSPGYYAHLQSAYLARDLPVELRYLAVIQLKNGIDKYWRKTAQHAVSKEDKLVIRGRLLEGCLNEPDERLALQAALVVAKVGRFEYPSEWPELIPQLTQVLRASGTGKLNPTHLSRALLVLLQVVKELSTGRLQRTRQTLQAAAPEVVHVLSSLYTQTLSYYNSTSDPSALELSLRALKVLRRLLIAGYEHPCRNTEVVELWRNTQQHLGQLLQRREAEKLVLQLSKLHLGMAKEHPASFALLPDSLELVRAYWGLAKTFSETMSSSENVQRAVATAVIGSDGDAPLDGEDGDGEDGMQEKLALRGLLLLRACVKMVWNPAQTFKYRTLEDKEEKNAATEVVRDRLLSGELVREVMEALVTRFFVFRARDLREWNEEPEEWEKREEGGGEDWEFSLRSCSEKLFLDLAINYKDMLLQPLLAVFYSTATLDNEDILTKDAVYTALGLAAPVVFEHLDFDAFIRTVVAPEVQKRTPGFNILRRRASILLAQWISVRISERALVYQIFSHLLDREDEMNDQVVRVTAGRQWAKVVDDWDTRPEALEPYADAVLTRLMGLVEEVELTETKMALLESISVTVQRMDHRIAPFAERIMALLPSLWAAAESGEEHLMKQAILTLLARLVNAMRADSQPIHGLVIPIIAGAVAPGSETQVYLLEDAMELWSAILVQTPAPAPQEVLGLMEAVYPLYDQGGEGLRKALEITESYVLLAPEYVLSDSVRGSLLSALNGLLGTLRAKAEASGMVCNILELLIRQQQYLQGSQAVDQLLLGEAGLQQTLVLPTLLEGLEGSYAAHCTTGPRAKEALVEGVVETDYFAILARIILGGSAEMFVRAFEGEKILEWLLEEWFSHFENIGDPGRRKLMALALTKLLETGSEVVLGNLQSLMTVWTDVITELRESYADAEPGTDIANGDKFADSLVFKETPGPALGTEDGQPEAPEDARRREMTYRDEVHTVSLPVYVRDTVGRVMASRADFEGEWVGRVDREVVGAFGGLGIMQ